MTLKRFKEVLYNQHEKGFNKYGQSLEEADLNVIEVIDHLEEELVDAFVYLQEIRRKVDKENEHEN